MFLVAVLLIYSCYDSYLYEQLRLSFELGMIFFEFFNIDLQVIVEFVLVFLEMGLLCEPE